MTPMLQQTVRATILVAALVAALPHPGSGQTLPADADRLAVEYDPASRTLTTSYKGQLGTPALSELILRARWYTDGFADPGAVVVVDTLRRGVDGAYRGSRNWPDSLTFAVFGVETPSGDRISHHEEGWTFLRAGADGRPTLAALEVLRQDVQRRDVRRAAAVADRMIALYPDSITAWASAMYPQEATAGPEAAPAVKDRHRVALARFDSIARSGAPTSADTRVALFFYSYNQDDSVRTAFWADEVARLHPEHRNAEQIMTLRLRDLISDLPARLARYEELWHSGAHAYRTDRHLQLPFSSFYLARRIGDTTAIRTWGERWLPTDRDAEWEVISTWLETPTMRERGITAARAQLAAFLTAGGFPRELTVTVPEHRAQTAATEAYLRSNLGAALVASGQREAALAELRRVVSVVWDADTFRSAADLSLAAGDTTSALNLYAAVAVDPATPRTWSDSVRVALRGRLDDATWTRLLQEARATMRTRLAQQRVDRPLTPGLTVRDETGVEVPLAPTDSITVIALWSRHCSPSLLQLGDLNRVSSALAQHGIRVLTLTDEPASPALSEFIREQQLTFPLYADPAGVVRRALGSPGEPSYFILDGRGHVRFIGHDPDLLLQHSTILAADPAPRD